MTEAEKARLRAELRQRQAAGASSEDADHGVAYQAMSGVNEGLASTLGFPVDAVTAGLNLIPGVDIQNPMLGSESIRNMMGSAISDQEPNSTAERYGRAIGREGGAMAVPGLGLAAKAQKPAQMMVLDGASSVGAGAAGQAVEDIAPEADTAKMIAQIIGGGVPIAAANSINRGPSAPTRDELVERQEQAYDAVDQSRATMPQDERDALVAAIRSTADTSGLRRRLHPRAADVMRSLDELPANPRLADIESARRVIARDVMGATEAGEQAIGAAMRKELDEYLAEYASSGRGGPEINQTLSSLQEGRDLTRRIKADEQLEDAAMRGERRAATSGMGGNEVNAIRQNLRGIIDTPRKSRSFNDTETDQMEAIVRGTPSVNFARNVGRFSPTSGALPAMGGMGAMYFSPEIAIGGGAIGYGAQKTAEALTQRQIEQLSETIRNGGPVAAKEASDTVKRSIAALLMSQSVNNPLSGQ